MKICRSSNEYIDYYYMIMKRTVKSCYKCNMLFIVYNNVVNGSYCKSCSIVRQNNAAVKLNYYMQEKYIKK